MRSKLKEIDSLCDAIIGTACSHQEDDATAGEIKAIVAGLLTEDWDCTLLAMLERYVTALKAEHSSIADVKLWSLFSHADWKLALAAAVCALPKEKQ
jgi:hypothetical protein